MKLQFLHASILLLFFIDQSVAQNYCGSPRYDTETFTNITITPDIPYGANTDMNGNNTILTMDIYEPSGDTAAMRPLIIWAHGGGFIGGTKNDSDITSLCNHFAKRGYVCASINYRLGVPVPPSQVAAMQAVYRAVQDMKAAIRYFRQDAATGNLYHVDPNLIVAAGSSAGAYTALHLAYMNLPSELPPGIDTTALGGLEGTSGNAGYSSHVNAVVNLCGALADTSWMHAGDIPVCSMHGTNDNVVPYATAMQYVFGIIPIMVVNGSYSISAHANSIGTTNVMYTFFGADHTPYSVSTAYMDTTVRFVSNFVYSYLGCTPSNPNPVPNTFTTVGIQETTADDELSVYPNPASGDLYIELKSSGMVSFRLTDASGRVMKSSENLFSSRIHLENMTLAPGIYFLKIDIPGKSICKKIFIN